MNTFTFNGKNSADFGLYVESWPNEQGGQKIIETLQIPGRTGTLSIDTGAISNIEKTYPIMFKKAGMATEKMRQIRQWLAEAEGYCRLEDSFDHDIFYNARVIQLPTFENYKGNYGRADIVFDCSPKRYLKSGQNEFTYSEPIINDYMESNPILKIVVTSSLASFTVSIGSTALNFAYAISGTYVIDCENKTVKIIGQSVRGEQYVNFDNFPTLIHGQTTIVSSAGNVSSISIIPNYWVP